MGHSFIAAVPGQLPGLLQRPRDVGAPRRLPLLLRDRRPLLSFRRTGKYRLENPT